MTRSFVPSFILLLSFLFAGTSGCNRQAVPEAAADTTLALPQVVAAKPERKSLRLSTTQPGKIEAFEQTPLHAKVAGFVEEVSVDIGDLVKKDQVLIRLSIPELHDEVAQQTAQLAQSEAELKQAEASIKAMIAAADTAESRIVEAEASISRTEAEHARWQSEYDRIGELAAKGSVTIKLEEEKIGRAHV